MAKETRVALLDFGQMFAPEYMTAWNFPSAEIISMPTFGVLIDHEDGRYLFDTGFDLHFFQTAVDPAGVSQTVEQTVPGQLKMLGMSPDDINYVVNSHYHFDHCGGNKHCRHAKTICHKCELEAGQNPQPFENFMYSDRSYQKSESTALDIYTPDFETLEGDQEIAAGVTLFETPGHSAGHYSLMVKLAGRRPMLFPADVVYSQKALDNMILPASHLDPVRAYQSIERIKALAEKHDAEIFFSHDAASFANYKKAPSWYS